MKALSRAELEKLSAEELQELKEKQFLGMKADGGIEVLAKIIRALGKVKGSCHSRLEVIAETGGVAAEVQLSDSDEVVWLDVNIATNGSEGGSQVVLNTNGRLFVPGLWYDELRALEGKADLAIRRAREKGQEAIRQALIDQLSLPE